MTTLDELKTCFLGVIPSVLATCGRDGEPNVTYISQVYLVDSGHVALSRQFFNKTARNLRESPFATALIQDPLTFAAYRLRLRFEREETEGELFESMSLRIQAIASHTGMSGIFRLLSADVCAVLAVERIEGYLLPADPLLDGATPLAAPPGPMTELRGLQSVSQMIARAADLECLLVRSLEALDEHLGFKHSMLLLHDECTKRLTAIASRGYGTQGIGAEVAFGQGVIGTVAERRRMLRISGVGTMLRYNRAIRTRMAEVACSTPLAPEIPLPGLPDAQAQLALPLLVGERLVGVLAVESRDPLCFDEWDEAYLQIVANQIAVGIDRMQLADDEAEPAAPSAVTEVKPAARGRKRTFVFYRNDDCVFVDGEYLVRNVPGKILWKVLGQRQRAGQVEFSNRELRLDPTLGLPPLKDNLESRLILLRKRLAEKCRDVRIIPVRRGRFALEVDCELELIEKDSA
jgi:putative methionine-R-sulfoxide reductase with GAF domain